MQALKVAVIVMGLLIIAGMGLLIYGIATRIGTDAGEQAAKAPGPSAFPAPGTFGEVTASLPEGAEVLEISSDGRRLMVRIGLFAGGQQVLIYDLDGGSRLGTLTLNREGVRE